MSGFCLLPFAKNEVVEEFGRASDEAIRAEPLERLGPAQAVEDGTGVGARALTGEHVGRAVSNHEAGFGSDAEGANGLHERERIGLLPRETVAAVDRDERAPQPQGFENAFDQHGGLVGNNDLGAGTKRGENVFDPRKRSRKRGQVCSVVVEEPIDRAVEVVV